MKYDYFSSFLFESERILLMLRGADLEDTRMKSKFWRYQLVDKIYEDFLPPFDRRDMLALVQNLSYLSFEVYNFLKINGIKNTAPYNPEIIGAVTALKMELEKLKHKNCNILRLKGKADKLLSLWYNAFVGNAKKEICDSLDAIAESFLKFCDALETAIIVNH